MLAVAVVVKELLVQVVQVVQVEVVQAVLLLDILVVQGLVEVEVPADILLLVEKFPIAVELVDRA
jgi:hypothetical protein